MGTGGYSPDTFIVKAGALGIRKSSLDKLMLSAIRSDLRVQANGYEKHQPEPFDVYTEDEAFIWVPRHYRLRFQKQNVEDLTTLGDPADLEFAGKLIEERDQPTAFEWMRAHLKENHAGILHAFTDFGKTYVSLALAAEFKRKVAVVTHLGHMLDNWVKVASEMYTLEPDEVGIFGGGNDKVGNEVTVMLAQTLTTKDIDPSFFDQFGFVVLDEVHHYGSKEWQRVPAMFPARYRLGVSATPERKDGLSRVVRWHCGPIAYKARQRTDNNSEKKVVQLRYQANYPYNSYCNWSKAGPGTVNPQKYRKKQMKDEGRNIMLVREMVNALKTGRKGLVQSHFRDHAERLHKLFLHHVKLAGLRAPKTLVLFGGATTKAEKAKQKEAHSSDWIFTTYGFTKEAISLPQIDTLVWATSPGDAAQALGRLRVAEGKRFLLCLDPYEMTDYGIEKADKRRAQMANLGAKVQRIDRKAVAAPTPKKKSKSRAKSHAQRGRRKQ